MIPPKASLMDLSPPSSHKCNALHFNQHALRAGDTIHYQHGDCMTTDQIRALIWQLKQEIGDKTPAQQALQDKVDALLHDLADIEELM